MLERRDVYCQSRKPSIYSARMKEAVLKYDTVYVYETEFQKSIVDLLLTSRPEGEERLVIDARDGKIRILDRTYLINLNGFKPTLKSFREKSRIPRISTDELVCTSFTGINCRLFPTLIEHRRLSIIDDGTGTPVMLKEGRYPIKPVHFKLRLLFSETFTLLRYGKFMPVDVRTILGHVSRYYTIYPFVQNGFKDQYMPFAEIIVLDYFGDKKLKTVPGLGFISTGACPEKSRELSAVFSETGDRPVYYPHPHEDLSSLDRDLVAGVLSPGKPLEDYFLDSGVPSVLYGEVSTVFINLKLMGCTSSMTVLYTFHKNRRAYYELLESAGICLKELM